MQLQEHSFVGSYLATKVFIGKLPAIQGGWVIIRYTHDERGSTTNDLTVIGVHLTMHLMHPNHCQITIIYSADIARACSRWNNINRSA